MGLRLKESYRLVDDGTRAILIAKRFHGFPGEVQFLDPSLGVVIALMDGSRDYAQLTRDMCDLFGVRPDTAAPILDSLLAWCPHAFENGPAQRADLTPAEFIVQASAVDVQKTRCEKPLYLTMDVTWKCGRSCRYCYAERRKGVNELPVDAWEHVFDQVHELGITSLLISGGDIFSRPDWHDLLGGLVTRDIFPIVSTKSYLSPLDCSNLMSLGVDELQVSLDSAVSSEAEELTGSPRYLAEAIKTIRNLKEAGVAVRCNIVVTQINKDSVIPTVSLLDQLGVTDVTLSSCGLSLYLANDGLLLSTEDKRDVAAALSGYHGRLTPTLSYQIDPYDEPLSESDFLNRVPCSAGRQTLTILPDGAVVPCEQLPSHLHAVGDVKTQTLQQIWACERLADFVMPTRERLGGLCSQCERFEDCQGKKGRCVRNALLAFGNPNDPDPRCPKAPRGRRFC